MEKNLQKKLLTLNTQKEYLEEDGYKTILIEDKLYIDLIKSNITCIVESKKESETMIIYNDNKFYHLYQFSHNSLEKILVADINQSYIINGFGIEKNKLLNYVISDPIYNYLAELLKIAPDWHINWQKYITIAKNTTNKWQNLDFKGYDPQDVVDDSLNIYVLEYIIGNNNIHRFIPYAFEYIYLLYDNQQLIEFISGVFKNYYYLYDKKTISWNKDNLLWQPISIIKVKTKVREFLEFYVDKIINDYSGHDLCKKVTEMKQNIIDKYIKISQDIFTKLNNRIFNDNENLIPFSNKVFHKNGEILDRTQEHNFTYKYKCKIVSDKLADQYMTELFGENKKYFHMQMGKFMFTKMNKIVIGGLPDKLIKLFVKIFEIFPGTNINSVCRNIILNNKISHTNIIIFSDENCGILCENKSNIDINIDELFSWMLNGYSKHGYVEPSDDNTIKHDANFDKKMIDKYIAECLVKDNNVVGVQSSELHLHYTNWCISKNIEYLDIIRFGMKIKLKFTKKRIGNKYFYLNIKFI